MLTALPTLTVSTIFLLWHALRRQAARRERIRNERIAYMLWRVAHLDDGDKDDKGDEPSSDSNPPGGENNTINATEIRLIQLTLKKK
jgi:hypothetical protein